MLNPVPDSILFANNKAISKTMAMPSEVSFLGGQSSQDDFK